MKVRVMDDDYQFLFLLILIMSSTFRTGMYFTIRVHVK